MAAHLSRLPGLSAAVAGRALVAADVGPGAAVLEALYFLTAEGVVRWDADGALVPVAAATSIYRRRPREGLPAVDFLRENGVRVETNVPSELHPGIDYAAHAFDADGHCIELYYYMEQVGWDGRARPASERRNTTGAWPDSLEPMSDTYNGEPFQGPWG